MGVNWSQHVWFALKTINEIHAGPSNDILVLRIGQDIPLIACITLRVLGVKPS